MFNLQVAMVFFRATVDKMRKFDYTKLIPDGKIEKYPYAAFGVEMTWREGLGLGVGVGQFDLWAGWPRSRQITNKAIAEKVRDEVLVGEIV